MVRFLSRKAFVVPVVALAALAMLPAVSQAGVKAGDWVLEIGGSGANTKSFNAGDYGMGVCVGYFLTDAAELVARQQLAYAYANHNAAAPAGVASAVNAKNGDTFAGDTQLAFHYFFPLGSWAPYVGANAGLSYGTNGTKTVWEAGPEGGLDYWINSTTYIYTCVEWNIFLNHTKAAGDSEFVYGVGLGVKL